MISRPRRSRNATATNRRPEEYTVGRARSASYSEHARLSSETSQLLLHTHNEDHRVGDQVLHAFRRSCDGTHPVSLLSEC